MKTPPARSDHPPPEPSGRRPRRDGRRHDAVVPVLTLLAMGAVACASEGPPPAEGVSEAAAEANAVARSFVHGYYRQFPEEAYETGYPDADMARLADRSLEAMAGWEAEEDSLLARLVAVDGARLEGTDAAVPWRFARERLEASVARRVCRTELWNVSPTWTGWQGMLPSVFAQQPVATPEERNEALSRVRDVARYLDVEVANLREGLALGYSAPRSNVDAVVAQVDGLLEAPVEDSPFFEPALRVENEGFRTALRGLVENEVRPAIRAYRDFLVDEYRPAARTAVGVSANPDGADCYRASVRFWSTLDMAPEEIHRLGLEQMERIQAEMREIVEAELGDDDVAAALERVRTDTAYTFPSEEAVLAYARSAVARAEAAVPDWFGFVPDAEVVVRPFPAFQKRSGGGFYSAGSADGSRPGTYELGTHAPETISRVGLEATAFHETYPGHHLQMSVALAREQLHPVLMYLYAAGMAEGWGLYSERLADEMGLYSGPLDRLGMLSNEALRAARLVVDPGMHALGWTRQRAVDYMSENTAESPGAIAYEVDRYVAVPGQATSYLLGSLEIQRLRSMAEERLGGAFDVKAFHDLVLADGGVTLPMLRDKVTAWVDEQTAGGG